MNTNPHELLLKEEAIRVRGFIFERKEFESIRVDSWFGMFFSEMQPRNGHNILGPFNGRIGAHSLGQDALAQVNPAATARGNPETQQFAKSLQRFPGIIELAVTAGPPVMIHWNKTNSSSVAMGQQKLFCNEKG